ncbi:branched-chain amino acid ABC transporter permease [Candidatus Synechococcus calcipolaris G9]|uniref:Branched-chain amino acid ABC transporter permease n=1 Tax=Candidatus Synechococcus calcipolaris G9 TaxID=1497997 RepID=A0ABT6F3K2_9SYNE|nr:branched-chain amino acid ABC transporter permease [Candidatus Synechococcus calcipolaris]MDG2992451.1 branched-chain amino acid ABC transporter permease [Candidatus Synechococcus calcipolaris G9]
MANSLQIILNGLSIGSVYGIFALGYTLVFSILGMINFAHGAMFAVGAYLTYALLGGRFGFNGLLAHGQLPFSLPFFWALLVSGLLTGCLGVAIEGVAFRPLRKRQADSLLTVVSSLGVAVALTSFIQYLVGAEIYTYPDRLYGDLPATIALGEVTLRTAQLVIFLVSIFLVALLTYWIQYTFMGKAMQAVAENPITASLLGIPGDRMIMVTFFISSFLAAVAGTLVASSVSITGPQFGMIFGLKGLAVIVLGGLGSVPGAVLAGFLIGIAEAMVPSQLSGFRDAIAFGILFMTLLIRPQGLMGRKIIEKV